MIIKKDNRRIQIDKLIPVPLDCCQTRDVINQDKYVIANSMYEGASVKTKEQIL
ncbi:hypothetical protein ES702_01543 [subsurface metagenome]